MEEEYTKLQKKYNLPGYNEMDKEFEISSIDKPSFLLKKILEKMQEQIAKNLHVLEEILQPDGASLSALYEFKAFNDHEKKEIFDVYKKLMIIMRQLSILILENDETKQARFISDFYKDWKNVKAKLIVFFNKLKESWEHDARIDEKLNYMG